MSRLALPFGTSLAIAVALLVGGCAVPDGPRPLPTPELRDPSAPFRAPGTVAGEATPADSESDGGFEARLRRLGTAASSTDEPSTEAQQTVRLGSGLIGRLPENGDDWSWAGDGELVLALHARVGDPPDTLIFAQHFAATAERRPAAELDAFLVATDPALASDWIALGSEIAPLALLAARGLDLEPWQALRGARLLLSPTLGRGLAYAHEPGSFSGWRWIGRNRHGTLVRLARTRGVWGGDRPAPEEVTRLVERLAAESPDLAPLLWREPAILPESRAAMVLGSATGTTGTGAHLAILCRLLPDCPTAEALGRFLDSLAAPGAADPLDTRPAFGGGDPRSLAERAGLVLRGDLRVDRAALVEGLRAVAAGVGSETDSGESSGSGIGQTSATEPEPSSTGNAGAAEPAPAPPEPVPGGHQNLYKANTSRSPTRGCTPTKDRRCYPPRPCAACA